MTTYVDLDNAREEEQRQVMAQIRDAEHCPFCPENLEKYHKQPMLREGQYWLITPNQWPYKHTKLHLLAILKRHAERLGELTPAEGAELFEHLAWIEREYQVAGGAVGLRFGDTEHSAGTVLHVHAQFLVPDLADPEYQPVRLKIGKSRWS